MFGYLLNDGWKSARKFSLFQLRFLSPGFASKREISFKIHVPGDVKKLLIFFAEQMQIIK